MPEVIISTVDRPTTIGSTPTPAAPPSGSITIYSQNGIFFQINSAGEIQKLTSFIDEFDLDFYEGTNPPYIADVDAFGFQDAAGFPEGENRDVIFKSGGNIPFWKRGFTIDLVVSFSATHLGEKVRWKLDYVVHQSGEIYNGGISYSQTVDMIVSASQDQLQKTQVFTIPNNHVTSSAVEVEFRLSRLGNDINDTFSGDVGLKHIVAKTI